MWEGGIDAVFAMLFLQYLFMMEQRDCKSLLLIGRLFLGHQIVRLRDDQGIRPEVEK